MIETKNATILVIDDEPKVRAMICKWLALAGYGVMEASDGEQAIQMFNIRIPDLVISDVFMPGVDGLETIGLIHRKYPHVKILALSGGGFNGTVDLLPIAMGLGAVETITKPPDMSILLNSIDRILQMA